MGRVAVRVEINLTCDKASITIRKTIEAKDGIEFEGIGTLQPVAAATPLATRFVPLVASYTALYAVSNAHRDGVNSQCRHLLDFKQLRFSVYSFRKRTSIPVSAKLRFLFMAGACLVTFFFAFCGRASPSPKTSAGKS